VRKSRSAGQLTLVPSFIIGQSARNTNDSVKISPRENALSPNSKNIEINRVFLCNKKENIIPVVQFQNTNHQ